MSMHALGRRPPTDWKHVEKFPLTAATAPAAPVPVVIGVNWYSAFDRPERDAQGRYWIGRGPLGHLRGGHCVCLKPRGATDLMAWWDFYDQGSEGACVGFGASRMMTLLNRKRYDARWLYQQAQRIDEWADTPPEEGTSVRAALDVLRARGHRPMTNGSSRPVALREGIAANRWAPSTQAALDVLGYGDVGYVDVLNSWGRDYPHLVRMPAEVLDVLRRQEGEIGLVVDR
jgi:hypothetical protein